MEDSPHLYISEFGDDEDIEEEDEEEEEEEEEEEMEDNDQEDNMEMDMPESFTPEGPDKDDDLEHHDSFPCQLCERRFTSNQGLERHIHIHALANYQTHTFKCKYCNKSFGSKIGRRRHERRHESAKSRPGSLINPVGSPSSFSHTGVLDSISSPGGSGTSILADGEQATTLDEHGELEGGHACKYCEKVFSTHTNKRRHERRIHERHLRVRGADKALSPLEETPQRSSGSTSQQEPQPTDCLTPVAVLQNGGEQAEHYMLDISSNISENLSFYIDGKIVSTSTVSSCEVIEVSNGSATLVGLDAVILDPAQISQALNIEATAGKEIPGQPLTKRRTATPPLLPQIKTELESEVVVSSSSSTASLVSSLIGNLLPQSSESTATQKERTVFLSPKLKQLLEKQDGLKPTLAVITDGQKLCSPLSLTVLPAGTGRFKRRTGSPTSSPQQSPTSTVENTTPDLGESDAVCATSLELQHSSPLQKSSNENEDTPPPVDEPMTTQVLPESWPSISGGNSCNQQPLDLSNAVKKNEEVSLAEAALDLSLQRKSTDDLESTSSLASQPLLKKKKPNTCVLEKVLMNEYANVDVAEQDMCILGNPEAPLVSDFALVAGSDMVTPLEPVTEGFVYGLALPSTSLAPSPSSLTPVALQPASPCTIALAAPASHSVLPTTPSLITVLAPSASIPNPLNQPIQVLAPNISPEPLVICTENTFNSSECDLTAAFATANDLNLVALSQPLDPALNLPGHMFLTDQITLNGPVGESAIGSELPFAPTVTLNDSLINSYNITSNTVLIECTIALDAPGNLVPTAITLQENTVESAAPAQMVINHIEQQQILSLPNPETVDPTILVSSIAESVPLSTTSVVMPDSPIVSESYPDPEPAVIEEKPTPKEETADESISTSEISTETSPPSEPAEVEESSNETPSDAQQQSFTKNFICNVCDKLFHSMKELGHHVSDHADEWPYKCEFCVLLFGKPSALLEHRSNLHGVGKTYVCSVCTKEFVYLSNLKHHQEELHPGQQCTYTEEEKGKLRPQNYNHSAKVNAEASVPCASKEPQKSVKKEEAVDETAEELFTTIKIMASDGAKLKGPDVRLGINQHYPSFKPPPFPYHNRSPAGAVASATNFTTHNIPQTFSTAIRCTKCGKSFDNMPELHKHILACANASDKRRYTPKKNPIPLRHFAKAQNGVLSTTNATNGLNYTTSQANGSKPNQEPPAKMKLNALNKRKKKLVQRAMSQRNKAASSSNKAAPSRVDEEQEVFVCPHCSREFTLRRSRTKHMAVCPRRPKEVKKRKDGGVSVTKENNGHLRRGVAHLEEKRHASAKDQRTRPREDTSSPAKRPAILPVHTVLSNKKTRMVVKEGGQTKREKPTLGDLPIVRTFNPSMRQYGRMQHGVKEIPIKITIVKPQQTPPQPKKEEQQPSTRGREGATGVVAGSQPKSATASQDRLMIVQQPARD